MGAIKLIREGIQQKDWEKVKLAYTELTGEEIRDTVKVETAVTVPKVEEQPSFLHKIRDPNKKRVTKFIDPDTGEEKTSGYSEPVNPDKIRAVGNLWNPNNFINDIPESEEKIKVTYQKPVPRTRKAVNMIKVVCVDCRKEYEIHPIYNRETGYHCDRCIKGKMPS